jgi:hypothetical protein
MIHPRRGVQEGKIAYKREEEREELRGEKSKE